jgi:hypothetical protein
MTKSPLGFLVLITLAFVRGAAAQETPPAQKSKPVAAQPAAKGQAKAPTSAPAKVPTKGAVRADRLDLETTVVSGNRELPKVLYIVPWKKADLGEMPAQPFNTLLDEVLQPVDRDVFKREVKYFQAVTAGAGAAKPALAPPPVTPQ